MKLTIEPYDDRVFIIEWAHGSTCDLMFLKGHAAPHCLPVRNIVHDTHTFDGVVMPKNWIAV
jgi:hypothetical protein